jgi:hypothetical protein
LHEEGFGVVRLGAGHRLDGAHARRGRLAFDSLGRIELSSVLRMVPQIRAAHVGRTTNVLARQ